MTIRQKLLATIYPIYSVLLRRTRIGETIKPESELPGNESFYKLESIRTDGELFRFSELKGKYVLIVNTASDCGYTAQYAELEKLQQEFKQSLVILAFPANDFKEQEPGTDREIETFCKKNYSISFPLMKKSIVRKDKNQNPVFTWLTDPNSNGWNARKPDWNFSKYLISPTGQLINYFGPVVSPLSGEIKAAIRGKSEWTK
jgi:glutathione peroxidase